MIRLPITKENLNVKVAVSEGWVQLETENGTTIGYNHEEYGFFPVIPDYVNKVSLTIDIWRKIPGIELSKVDHRDNKKVDDGICAIYHGTGESFNSYCELYGKIGEEGILVSLLYIYHKTGTMYTLYDPSDN